MFIPTPQVNKFKVGDQVYCTIAARDIYTVDIVTFDSTSCRFIYGIKRMTRSGNYSAINGLHEKDLISKADYETNLINQFSESFKNAFGFAKTMPKTPKCVCGAHAVKSNRHSEWCEIKT